jgi:enoyl-CoA hydratase/carnithine racemase
MAQRMSGTMEQPVLFALHRTASGPSFGRATLNAPASLNALTLPMIELLSTQLANWAQDDNIIGVILDATGDKAFCAGGDVVALYNAMRSTPAGHVPQAAAAFFEHEYRLDYAIHKYPKPIVCWGHGIVMGGGIGLFAGASHRVATERTRLAMPEISLGLYPDVGGSWFLSRMPGQTGLFAALTGCPLNASDALYAGLADAIVAHADFGRLLESIANATWHGDQGRDGEQLTQLLQALRAQSVPAPNLQPNAALIDRLCESRDLAQIAPALLALCNHQDVWLAQAARVFAAGSPTSARLAHTMQEYARNASLADVFRLEYQASVGCCMQHDFAEGVRALLIDKDKNPHWSPATLAEVDDELIAQHLSAHHTGLHPLADLN